MINKVKTVSVWFVVVIFVFLYFGATKECCGQSLESGFGQPPQIAKPLVWWDWVNGSITKEGIKADLTDMKRAGIGGVQLFDLLLYMPEGPVRYGSDLWHEHVQYAIKTADSLGLEFHIMNCPGWSASGGPWITPEKSMKKLVWTEVDFQGPVQLDEKLPMPKIKEKFYREIAVFAVPADNGEPYRLEQWKNKISFPKTTASTKRVMKSLYEPDEKAIPKDKVLNLTKYLSADGKLSCTIPQGKWTIIRFGFTSTGAHNHPAVPEGHGLECDKFDTETVAFQFDKALGRIIKEAKPYLGKTFKGILFDSFEGGYQNWSKKIPAEFKEINGYDLIPYLPTFTGRVIESAAISDAVLYDFRNTVDKLFAKNYFGTMQKLAHQNKLIMHAESQGGPLNPFYINEYVDVPMNEFWLRNAMKRVPLMKQSVASAHLYGKNIVGAESFTAIPDYAKWQNTPSSLKRPGDIAFTAGINRFIFHTYIHQPYAHLKPGFTMGRYGTHFGRQNTWWKFVPAWTNYLGRCQFLLQQGNTVTDICFLINDDIRYSLPAGDIKVPLGYDLTMCYSKHLEKMNYRDGEIIISDRQKSKIMVMPKRPTHPFMSIEALKKVHRLVKSGAVIVGNTPTCVPGLKDFLNSKDEFQQLVTDLWGGLDKKKKTSKAFGKGKVFLPAVAMKDIMTELSITPDIEFVPSQKEDEVRYIHRKTDNEDIYFITNLTKEPVSLNAKMRVTGKVPQLWNPVNGKMWDATVFNTSPDSTDVLLNLNPHGSIFVIFRDPLPKKWVTSIEPEASLVLDELFLTDSKDSFKVKYSDKTTSTVSADITSKPITIEGPWQVKFLDGRGAPERITLDHLGSWAEHQDEDIKHYSGIAEYTKKIEVNGNFIKKGQTCILDLGEVCDIAQVSINNSKPVILWKKPFLLNVTDYLSTGENTITIEVANRWMNRLIGDEQIPVERPYQQGGSKFTSGRIQAFPDWLSDPKKAKEQNKRHTFSTWKHYSVDSPLVPSGLLGPVKLSVFTTLKTIK